MFPYLILTTNAEIMHVPRPLGCQIHILFDKETESTKHMEVFGV